MFIVSDRDPILLREFWTLMFHYSGSTNKLASYILVVARFQISSRDGNHKDKDKYIYINIVAKLMPPKLSNKHFKHKKSLILLGTTTFKANNPLSTTLAADSS